MGEEDDVVVYPDPDIEVLKTMREGNTRTELWENLPMEIGYNRQTQNSDHLERILQFIKVREGMRILDLGTRRGYLSFPIARNNPRCEVIGLDIEQSIGETSRVLKEGGMLFISNPCPNEYDTERFVDDYMRHKKDGHIRFYTKDEWTSICGRYGLSFVDDFESSIRFPKRKETAFGYEEMLKKHDKTVIDSHDLVEMDTELFITEQVNNIIF